MLSISSQHALASRYGGSTVKLAFKSSARPVGTLGALPVQFTGDHEVHAAAIYVDIAGFARMVQGKSASAVRAFLDGYYAATLPTLFEAGGMVDRIAGDGIVAVFSTFFGVLTSNEQAEVSAHTAARKLIQTLHGTQYAAKAAASAGVLLFCKTGIAAVYEEFTVIGTPLTELYRIEDVAEASEIVHRADNALGRRVLDALASEVQRRLLGLIPAFSPPGWHLAQESKELRGVNDGALVPLVRERWG
jgi:class 3 adenylate cyclase